MQELTAKQECFVEYYCNPKSDTYNNAVRSYARANYSQCKGWKVNAMRLLHKDYIQQAIQAYRAKNKVKSEYDYDRAMYELQELISFYRQQMESGNIKAGKLLLAALKEKSELSGLHIKRTKDESGMTADELAASLDRLTAEERRLAEIAAEIRTKEISLGRHVKLAAG